MIRRGFSSQGNAMGWFYDEFGELQPMPEYSWELQESRNDTAHLQEEAERIEPVFIEAIDDEEELYD